MIQNSIAGSAFVVFVIFFFFPVFRENQRLGTVNRELRTKIQTAHAKIASIPQMKQQKEIYGARIAEVRGQFFDPGEVDQLLEIISKVATGASAEITASRPAEVDFDLPAPFDQQYGIIGYDLTLAGRFHPLGLLINGLEEHAKNFMVYEFRIAKNESDPTVLESAIRLAAFVRKTDAAGGTGAPKL